MKLLSFLFGPSKEEQIKEVTGLISKLEKLLDLTEGAYMRSIEFAKDRIELGDTDSAKQYAIFAVESEFKYKSIKDALYVSNCAREYLCTGNFQMSKYEQLRRRFMPDVIESLTKCYISYEHAAREIICKIEAKTEIEKSEGG